MEGLKHREFPAVQEVIELIIQQLEGLNHRQDLAEGPDYLHSYGKLKPFGICLCGSVDGLLCNIIL